MDETGFAFDNVVVQRGEARALDGLTAVVPGDGLTAVFGPSGSGKTTLLRLCNRLEVPTAGRVLFRGHDITGLEPLRLRRQVGMVFQRPTPFPGTVAGNLRVAVPEATEAAIKDALDRVALTGADEGDWLDRDATTLSGGEAQRMCLARTLITRPEVLLLDEPTSAVDDEAARIIERTARELAGDGVTVLWVTHDQAQVERIADRVLRIERGRCTGVEDLPRPADGAAGSPPESRPDGREAGS
ncbi:ABC transporter ATP-binding protein [Flindersiella endophytica]